MDGWNWNINTFLLRWSISWAMLVSGRVYLFLKQERKKNETVVQFEEAFNSLVPRKKRNAMSQAINKNIAMKWTYSLVHWFGIHQKIITSFLVLFFSYLPTSKTRKIYLSRFSHFVADVNRCCPFFWGGGKVSQLRQCEARNGDMLFPYHPSMYSYVLVWYITVLRFACF